MFQVFPLTPQAPLTLFPSQTLYIPPSTTPHPYSLILSLKMSGVWVFKNGVVRLENPASGDSRKALLYIPSNEVITSYSSLERKLLNLGWERYYEDPDLLQFHKRSSLDLISLPKDFSRFRSVHMLDIVVKNRETFKVIDA